MVSQILFIKKDTFNEQSKKKMEIDHSSVREYMFLDTRMLHVQSIVVGLGETCPTLNSRDLVILELDELISNYLLVRFRMI